jgi:hypothetical protein
MIMSKLDLSGLPKELRDKIIDILEVDNYQPIKKPKLQDVLGEMDLPRDKKNEILKILDPKNVERAKQEELNHTRLENLVNKTRPKPESPAVTTLRNELKRRSNERKNAR